MRAMKWIGIAIGGLLGVIIIALVLVGVLFDPNDYKADIERLVEEKTQRKLTLEGDLKLSLFPWLAVEAGPAQLGDRPGFGAESFISINQARLSIRLMPLLHGQVEIGDVLLKEPRIHVVTDERGRHNWSDLAEGDKPQSEPKNDTPTASPVSASVASLRIEKGAVVIEDRKEKTRTSIRDFNLSTGNVASGKPFDLKLSLVMEEGNKPAIPLKLAANVATDFATDQHVLKDFQLDSTWYADAAPGKKNDGVPVALKVQSLVVDMKQQTVAATGIALAFGDAKLSGALNGKQILDAPQFSGEIALAPISPRELMRQAGVVPPITRDADVLKKLSLQANVVATSKSAAMEKVELKLDDTTARGDLSITDFATTALRFDLNVDRVDFDRYLPPPEEAKAAKDAPAKETPPTPIPVDVLRALNAKGDLKIGEAKFSGLKFAKLHLGVNAHAGDVRFAPTDASLYGGDYRGTLAIDASGKTPTLSVESHASNIDFAPLFKDMFQTQKISGRGHANVKVTASGADTLALQKALNGNLDFNVTNGAFEGTDLWYEIKRARALLNREAAPERTGAVRTVFTTCKGTGAIQNGVLTNNDLDMAMQYLKVGGQGSVDIVKSTLDYKLNVQVLRMQDDPSAQELVDAQIPVKVSGSLSSPSVRPDVEGMAKARLKQEVDKQKDKVQKKLQDKLQDLLRR